MSTYWDLLKRAYDPTPAVSRKNPISPVGMPAGITEPQLELQSSQSIGQASTNVLNRIQPMTTSITNGTLGNNGPNMAPTTPTVETSLQVPNTPAGPKGGMGQPPSGQQPNRANNVHATTFTQPTQSFKAAFVKAGEALGLSSEECDSSWAKLYQPKTPAVLSKQ